MHNLVWLTADVHYAAAHFYDPTRARFQDFDPFWEFVSGPLHAGTFGPNVLDDTFGPQLRFLGIPEDLKPNRPPSEGFQFFGLVDLDAATKTLTVTQHNAAGETLLPGRTAAAPPVSRRSTAGIGPGGSVTTFGRYGDESRGSGLPRPGTDREDPPSPEPD